MILSKDQKNKLINTIMDFVVEELASPMKTSPEMVAAITELVKAIL